VKREEEWWGGGSVGIRIHDKTVALRPPERGERRRGADEFAGIPCLGNVSSKP
jgi:hypothetical protein